MSNLFFFKSFGTCLFQNPESPFFKPIFSKKGVMPTSSMGRRLDKQNSAEINLATNVVKNTVAFNGVKTNALVDTCASISVISTAFLSKTSFETTWF